MRNWIRQLFHRHHYFPVVNHDWIMSSESRGISYKHYLNQYRCDCGAFVVRTTDRVETVAVD